MREMHGAILAILVRNDLSTSETSSRSAGQKKSPAGPIPIASVRIATAAQALL